MPNGNPRRRRSDLSTAVSLPQGNLQRFWHGFWRVMVLRRLGLCLLATLCMWGAMGSWAPPFAYQIGDTPARGIVTRQRFSVEDPAETQKRQRQAEAQTLCVYQHDKQPLVNLRQALKDRVFRLNSAASFEKLTVEERSDWNDFLTMASSPAEQNAEQLYNDFRDALAQDKDLAKFERESRRCCPITNETGCWSDWPTALRMEIRQRSWCTTWAMKPPHIGWK